MAEQNDQPDRRSEPVKKAPAKKAPAKRTPAKKAAAKKAPAKKAPAKKAPAKQDSPAALQVPATVPALGPAPVHAALTSGPSAAGPAAVSLPPAGGSGFRIPLTIGVATLGVIALLIRRLRRRRTKNPDGR